MASIFGHAIVGFTLSKLTDIKERSLMFLAIGSSLLPDIDVLTFNFGIAYGSPWGHRGFTHSICFALIWALALTAVLRNKDKITFFSVIFLSTLSHGILDAFTTGGYGVGFLIPFENERYFFQSQVITVSPLGISGFFSNWGWRVLMDEFRYIFVPSLIILGISYAMQFVGKKN